VIYMATMAALYGILDALFVAIQSRLLRWKE
jgi:sulfonate transport system permease protein